MVVNVDVPNSAKALVVDNGDSSCKTVNEARAELK